MGSHPATGAMSLWESCFLGALQGLTEFLPISSSGHLAVVQHFLPGRAADAVAVDVALHLGTLVAVIIYFARDLWLMARSVLRPVPGAPHGRRWLWYISVASLPALLAYVAAGPRIEAAFDSLVTVGGNLLLTAAVLVGTAQAVALLPGVSRSGVTIAAGLLTGLRGDVAARFSFLLSVPAVIGAQVVKLDALLAAQPDEREVLAVGMLVAGVTGLVAIDVLLRLVRRGKLSYFAVYCAGGGALTVAAGLFGW